MARTGALLSMAFAALAACLGAALVAPSSGAVGGGDGFRVPQGQEIDKLSLIHI